MNIKKLKEITIKIEEENKKICNSFCEFSINNAAYDLKRWCCLYPVLLKWNEKERWFERCPKCFEEFGE